MKMSLLIIDEMIIDQTSCADKGLVKKYGGGGPEKRGGGSWGFEPCARGGSCNLQLPLRGGSPYFIT